jgi:hypothetical protein
MPFGGAGAENLAQSCPPCVFSIRRDTCFHPAHLIQTLSTGGGGDWGTGWARGPLSAARLTLHHLHLSRLPRTVMALQTATALQCAASRRVGGK